jgi:predicted DsbA family dithiol-disulfide isomerase
MNATTAATSGIELTHAKERGQRFSPHAYEEAGVTGVPMFVIGSQVLTGLQDRETREAVIEEEKPPPR